MQVPNIISFYTHKNIMIIKYTKSAITFSRKKINWENIFLEINFPGK